jgi:hypothetical protein
VQSDFCFLLYAFVEYWLILVAHTRSMSLQCSLRCDRLPCTIALLPRLKYLIFGKFDADRFVSDARAYYEHETGECGASAALFPALRYFCEPRSELDRYFFDPAEQSPSL